MITFNVVLTDTNIGIFRTVTMVKKGKNTIAITSRSRSNPVQQDGETLNFFERRHMHNVSHFLPKIDDQFEYMGDLVD